MLLAGCSPQGTSQPPGPQAEGRLAALVLWGPTTLAGRVPAESAGRCPQLLENKSVSPSGRLKVTQPFAGDRPASQVLPPPGVCVTLESWARPGVNSSEAFLRCQWAWLLRLGVGAGNTMERGYLWGRGDRVRHKTLKASLGLGVPLDVSGSFASPALVPAGKPPRGRLGELNLSIWPGQGSFLYQRLS